MFLRTFARILIVGVGLVTYLPGFAGDDATAHFFNKGIAWDFAIPQTMNEKLIGLAGIGAINCGWVRIGQDPSLPVDCAQKALATQKPFYVRYDLRSIDSVVARGVSFNKESGSAYLVDYFRHLIRDRREEQIITTPCSAPIKLDVTEEGVLTCYANHAERMSETVYPLERYN